jgi:hypothetical protein
VPMIRRSCGGSFILSSLSTAFIYAGPIRIIRSGLLSRMALSSGGKCLLPALVVELAVRLVQQLEHQAVGLILIAQRNLLPEFQKRGRLWTGSLFISS